MGMGSSRVDQEPADGTPLTPVFTSGQDGYVCYRIPSIVRCGDGSLLAVAEGRLESCGDHGGIIRVVTRRSLDDGRSWGPLVVVGRNILANGSEWVAANPSPVVDRMDPANPRGVIYLVFNKTEYSEHDVAAGVGVRRVFLARSADHGASWEAPRDITAQVHRPHNPAYTRVHADAAARYNCQEDWRQVVAATGHGIQLEVGPRPGRLFYIAAVTVGGTDVYHMRNYAFWSDDHGKTWQASDPDTREGYNESMAVELEDGSILVNARNYRDGSPVGRRAISRIRFDARGKAQFRDHHDDPGLVEPTVQASIQRYSRSTDAPWGGCSRILFSAPDHPSQRVNLTVRLSYDEGKTWPVRRTLDPGPSAYSDLVIQADGKIGVFYERGNSGGIYYTSFSLEWLERSQV